MKLFVERINFKSLELLFLILITTHLFLLQSPLPLSPEAPVPCPHVADFTFLQSKMGTDHRERSERLWMNITGLVHQLRDAQQFPGPQSAGAGVGGCGDTTFPSRWWSLCLHNPWLIKWRTPYGLFCFLSVCVIGLWWSPVTHSQCSQDFLHLDNT